MHSHLPANLEIPCTIGCQKRESCSFLDSIRYLIGINDGFQYEALRWGDHQRGRHAESRRSHALRGPCLDGDAPPPFSLPSFRS